jgi:hypothetical protein
MRTQRRIVLAVFTLCGTAASSVQAAPQAPTTAEVRARTSQVTTITAQITVDGILNEPAWVRLRRSGTWFSGSRAGQPPTERTDVTLLRDNDTYIGIYAYDSEPGRVIGTQMARDVGLMADDRIEILLDTFRDQRSAFYFATNPAGALVDGLAFANGQLNIEWDAIWQVRTSRTDQGWVAEFAIPFKSLSFPAGQDVWGFNVARTIYRKLEDNRWTGARLETQFLQVSEAGEIGNLGGLSQGIGLDLRPFFAGRWLHFGRTALTSSCANRASICSTTSRRASS